MLYVLCLSQLPIYYLSVGFRKDVDPGGGEGMWSCLESFFIYFCRWYLLLRVPILSIFPLLKLILKNRYFFEMCLFQKFVFFVFVTKYFGCRFFSTFGF